MVVESREFELNTVCDQTSKEWKDEPPVEEAVLNSGIIPDRGSIDVLEVSIMVRILAPVDGRFDNFFPQLQQFLQSIRSITAALSLVHQLGMSAQKRWRRLRGFRYLAKMSADVRFINGMEEKETGEKAAGFRTAINQICRNSYKYPRRNVLMQLQDNDSYVLSTVNGKDDKSFY